MAIKQEVIVAFFEGIESLEADKKEIADEIKANFEAFAGNQEINKKAVQKAYKEWKEYKKDKAEYTEVDYECDAILVATFPELSTEATA